MKILIQICKSWIVMKWNENLREAWKTHKHKRTRTIVQTWILYIWKVNVLEKKFKIWKILFKKNTKSKEQKAKLRSFSQFFIIFSNKIVLVHFHLISFDFVWFHFNSRDLRKRTNERIRFFSEWNYNPLLSPFFHNMIQFSSFFLLIWFLKFKICWFVFWMQHFFQTSTKQDCKNDDFERNEQYFPM